MMIVRTHISRGTFWAVIGVIVGEIVMIGLAILLAFWSGPAWSHSAPMGWSYGLECCSLRDCRQASPDEIRVTPTGYQLVTTGEVVEFTSRRIKQSQDQFYHVCQQGGNFDSGRILCIYVPPVSG